MRGLLLELSFGGDMVQCNGKRVASRHVADFWAFSYLMANMNRMFSKMILIPVFMEVAVVDA
jgi:hypothetical protein